MDVAISLAFFAVNNQVVDTGEEFGIVAAYGKSGRVILDVTV